MYFGIKSLYFTPIDAFNAIQVLQYLHKVICLITKSLYRQSCLQSVIHALEPASKNIISFTSCLQNIKNSNK